MSKLRSEEGPSKVRRKLGLAFPAAEIASAEPPAKPAVRCKFFKGNMLLYRRRADGRDEDVRKQPSGSQLPKFRHHTLASAKAEAERLLRLQPGGGISIQQEIGFFTIDPVQAQENGE